MPEITYREAVRDALADAMRSDDDVFIMGEDIAEMGGSMGVTQGLLDEFGPERVRNTPISEMAIVGAGIGAAMPGMRPVVEIMYEDFLTLSLEQIVNQAAKHRYMSGGQIKVPLTIRTQGGAGWSPGAQHAQQLEAWLVHIPGLKVVYPSTAEDVRGLLWSSIYDDNPVIFFEHRLLYPVKGDVPEEIEPIPLGKARTIREGTDVTVIAIGPLVHRSVEAAERAEEEGISVEVIDPRTLQPLDEAALVECVKKTNRVVVAHEAVTRMGFGAEVTAVLQYQAFDYLDAPIERVGAKFAPLAFAPVMEQFVVPDADDVLAAIRRTVGKLMANEVKLPRLGQGMEAGTINKWLKSEGDTVAKGEPLFEVDTDKVTQEVESDFAGVLLKIVLPSGEVPVGQTIAWIGEAGEEVKAEAAEARLKHPKPERAKPSQTARCPDSAGASHRTAAASRPRRSRAGSRASAGSTCARCRAPAPRAGSSPRTSSAVRLPRPAPVAVPAGEVESVPLTSIRKTIARRLTAAWEVPVFQLTVSADMTRANELVARARELNPDVRVTVTDLLAKVCAHALMRHRDVNVQYTEDALLRFPTANIGIAVAAPQGLVVPVIRSVERLTLAELAAARGEVVEPRAREQADDAAIWRTARSPSPTSACSGSSSSSRCSTRRRLRSWRSARRSTRRSRATARSTCGRCMSMTLTVDHRAVDGAAGADFLRTVKQFVEEPALAL